MIEIHTRTSSTLRLMAATVLASTVVMFHGQAATKRPAYPVPAGGFGTPVPLQLPSLPTAAPITANGAVVADVIARVNDEIITRGEYEHAEQQMLGDAQQQNDTQADLQDRVHNLLRDMIDQQILLSKGKELGITGDADLIRQLDEIRKQNHFDSLEQLQKAAEQQGVSYEDFKQHIREQAITQQVVRDEVGRRINMTHGQENAYYQAHGKDFEVPEQVHLSEILVPTPESATDAQIAAAQTKADELETKLKGGANFVDVAKSSSGGPTASAGGDLGDFKRGMLGDVLEKATFPLAVGAFTAPIRTRQGFVILRTDSHQAAGIPPLEDVEQQVQEAIYLDQLQPALRAYLTKAREDAYIDIKPGFVDTGSTSSTNAKPSFTAYTPPPLKKKTLAHEKEEQEKAAVAQAQLAAARQRVAEKNAEKASSQAAAQAAKGGAKNASMPLKPQKVHREKIRYGQAPQNSLPSAPVAVTEGTALGGQAPGTAMAMAETTTSISTGNDGSVADPFAPQAGPTHKTRYAQHQIDAPSEQLEKKVVKTEERASIRPVLATTEASATEKQQAAPLGLNGDTSKKKKQKDVDAPKSRLQDQTPTKPTAPAEPIAPTVNPALVASPTSEPKVPAKSSDSTTLAPADTPAPGAMPQGQPIPATTSAQPNQPATTSVPH